MLGTSVQRACSAGKVYLLGGVCRCAALLGWQCGLPHCSVCGVAACGTLKCVWHSSLSGPCLFNKRVGFACAAGSADGAQPAAFSAAGKLAVCSSYLILCRMCQHKYPRKCSSLHACKVMANLLNGVSCTCKVPSSGRTQAQQKGCTVEVCARNKQLLAVGSHLVTGSTGR